MNTFELQAALAEKATCQSIDLHIHSRYSDDGEYSPSDLVGMCAGAGIRLFAIADHNTVRGVGEALACARQWGIECYPAIEINCVHQGLNFHVLGYHINYESQDFAAIEQNVRRQCLRASLEQLRLVNQLGFDISEEALRALADRTYWPECWTAEMIAEVLLEDAAYAQHPLLQPYLSGDRSDNPYVNFYWDYCAQGKPCHAAMTFPEMREVIGLIHRNGGQAVLAHPGVNLEGQWETFETLIPLGLDGVEAYSSYHDSETANWFADKARAHGLLLTRGSDFHGKTKPAVHLGQAEKPCSTAR